MIAPIALPTGERGPKLIKTMARPIAKTTTKIRLGSGLGFRIGALPWQVRRRRRRSQGRNWRALDATLPSPGGEGGGRRHALARSAFSAAGARPTIAA